VGAQLPAIRAFKNLYGFTPLRTIYEMLGMPTHRQFTPKAFLNRSLAWRGAAASSCLIAALLSLSHTNRNSS